VTDTINTDPITDRETAPFQPTEEWIDAFQAQCTDKLRLDLRAYARYRARGVRRVGGLGDDAYADDLVADALADTLFGVVAWDPSAKSLYDHARDTIRYRTRDDRKHAKRYQVKRMDAMRTGDARATRGLVEASLQQDHAAESPDTAILASEVLDQLRALATGDPPVLRYLDALVAGASTRPEIMEIAGLSMKAFRNTRDRLGRLVAQLDQRCATTASYLRGARA
jgi:hypothetical protein